MYVFPKQDRTQCQCQWFLSGAEGPNLTLRKRELLVLSGQWRKSIFYSRAKIFFNRVSENVSLSCFFFLQKKEGASTIAIGTAVSDESSIETNILTDLNYLLQISRASFKLITGKSENLFSQLSL